MFSLIQESYDPHFNLAAEEYLFQERKEDFLVFSVNNPSVIIGKHQVAHREVNTRFTEKKNIPVLRRISGGGAVYHDRGNLNFAFIRQSENGKQVDFRYYTKPVTDFLRSEGITATFEGKNDLTVDGLKISGNAEHVFRERVLHHGTLLFDASIENMRNSLKQSGDHYSSKGVESNRSSVTNLISKFKSIKTTGQLMSEMLRYFRSTIDELPLFSFDSWEVKRIKEISEKKYLNWEWNWGYGPPYTFTAVLRLAGKTCRCSIYVKDGIIWKCDIAGDPELSAAGKKIVGCRHMFADMKAFFMNENLGLTDEEIYGFF